MYLNINYGKSKEVYVFLKKYYPRDIEYYCNKIKNSRPDLDTWQQYNLASKCYFEVRKRWEEPERFEKEIKPYLPDALEFIDFLSSNIINNCHAFTSDGRTYNASGIISETVETEKDLIFPGCYIIYWGFKEQGKKIIHSGIVEADGRIRSKWGSYPVFLHNVFDVPYAIPELSSYSKCEVSFRRRGEEIFKKDSYCQ